MLETFLKRVQHRPSARGQEELPHKDGGHVDREASSSGKEQHVALERCRSHQSRVSLPTEDTHVVGSESSRGERARGLGLVAWMVEVHRH